MHREEVSLRLKGMKGDGVNLGHQQVRKQSKRDVNGSAIKDEEAIKEVFWWKYVGVTLQGDLRQKRELSAHIYVSRAG